MATPIFDPIVQRALELQAQARAQQQAAEQAELQRQQAEQARLATEAERNRSRTVGEFAGDLGAGLLQTSMNLGGAAYGLANMATLGGLDRVAGLSENFQQANQIVEGWKSAPLQARQQDVQAAFDRGALDGAGELITTPSVLGDYAVQSLGYLLPGAAAARAGAAVGATRAMAAGPVQPGVVSAAAQQAATRAGLATQAGQTAGYLNVDAINAARDAGRSEGEAQLYGLGGGAIGAVVGPALSKLTGAASLEARAAQIGMGTAAPTTARTLAGNAATLGAFTGTQAVEEGAQETYENMVRNWAAGNELTQGNAQAAVTGGILGGVFGAAMGATQVVRQPSPARTQTEQAKAEIVDTLASDTGESPLRLSLLDSLALPAPAPVLALPAPNTLYASPDGSVQPTGPVINVDGTAQPATQAQTWVNPTNTPQPSFGAGMEQQVARGQRREIPLDSPLVADMPLEQVAERFGHSGFIAEAARRQNATATPPQPSAAPATDTARIAARNDFIKRAKLSSSAASTAALKPIYDDVIASDLRPGTPEFDIAVGVRARALADNIENGPGKTRNAPKSLTSLAEAYPVDDGTYAEFRTSAAFDGDRRYVPILENSEEAIFGQEPSVPAVTVPTATVPANTPTLLSEIAMLGGIGTAYRTDILRDTAGSKKGFRGGNVFTRAGTSPDDMATAMYERGYITEDEYANQGGVPRLYELIERSYAGEKVYPVGSPAYEAQLEQQAQQAAADRAEASALADPTLQETLSEQAVPANDLANLVAALDAAETNEQLQQAFAAMQTDPAYARIYAAGGADFTSLMNHMAGRVNALTGAKFELGGVPLAKPISTALFTKGVITANNNLGGNVQGFDTTADLAAAVGFPIPANAKGMYHNGNIYVVRENIASAKDLAYTLAHEVGHGGLDKLLGDSLTAATNRMWANPAMRQRIKTKQAELGDSTSRAAAAEEVLADMLASGERLNKDLWAKLRAGVREFFARVFGLRGVAISNAEVDALLGDVARVIQGAPAAQVRATMTNPSLWLTNPVLAAQQDPKFAKVKVDLDQAMQDAANETEGNVVPLSRLAKAAGEAGVDAVKAMGQALKMGKVGELWVNYMMHLDHMVAFYDKDFGGRLGTVAKLKELQQAEFTRNLAEEKTREFKPGKAEGETMAKRSINGIMEDWEAFRNANPARGQLLDFVQTEATFYKLFPTLPWNQQTAVDHAVEGYTLGERKAAYDAVRKAYLQMGSTAQNIYKQSQASYAALDTKRWQVLLDEVDRQGKVTEQLVTDKEGHQRTITRIKGILHNAMRASKAGSYSPLQRYGKYLATVRNALGEVVYFAGYDTQAEADTAVDTVLEARKQAGETGLTGNTSIEQKFDWSSVGVSAGTIEQLRRDAEDVIPAGLDQQTRQIVLNTLTTGLTEAYLQALPTKSFLKHALGRKNVAGYDGDSLRGFANYAIRASRNIASIKYDGQIDSALTQINQYVKDVEAGKYLAEGEDRTDTTKLRAVAAAVRQQHLAAASHQTSAFVSAATGASFTYMMTSPSQMLMNATQTLLVTLPRMQAEYGAARTGREILKAAADYVKSRGDLLGQHSTLVNGSAADQTAHAALTRIREDGPLDQSQAHDAAGLADGSADALSPYWGKVMKWMSYFMHKSEVFNRQVTALAAARLEQSKNAAAPVEALAESGKFWIRTTHFNYDKYNKPVALNTQIGTLLGQFRQYQIHMLSLMAKDIRDAELGKAMFFKDPINKEEAAIARRTLSYMLGAQLAFTGVAGTVLAPVAFAIADAFRALDDDEYLVDSKTEFAAMIPTWAMHGLFGLGMDTGRISAATLLPVIGQRDYAPIGGKASETFAYYVTQNLGPSFGLAKNLLDGSQSVVNGDFQQATQKLLPKPAADAIKAVYEGQNGATDMRGIMYGQPSIWSGVNQLVGIRSAERRDLEQPRGAAYQISQRAYQFKERAKLRVALAQSTGDMDLYRETLDDVQRFNSQYPDYRVRPAELVSAARSRMRTENVAAATGVVSSRLPGPTLDAYLGR